MAFFIRIGDQVVRFVIGIGTRIAALIPHAHQIVPVIIRIQAFRPVTIHDPDRIVSVVIRNHLPASIRIGHLIHAPGFIICHPGNIAQPVCLFRQPSIRIITLPYPFSCQLYPGHVAGLVKGVFCRIPGFIRKNRCMRNRIIGHTAIPSPGDILRHYFTKDIIPVSQVVISQAIRDR